MTDVEGSTELWEHQATAMAAALAHLDTIVAESVESNHGRIVKPRGEGDSHFLVFASAPDAVACAIDLQHRLAAADWPTTRPLLVRAAVHVGSAELREADFYGPTVNRCARLRAAAAGGQTLLSDAAAEATNGRLPEGAYLADLGLHRLKDLRAPEQVWELVDPALGREFPAIATLSAVRHNLPIEVSSFVGREADIADVTDALRRSRLVSICGVGGLGKTRIAMHVAASVADDYPDGVWFVGLADVDDPALVATEVATAAGLRVPAGADAAEVVSELLPRRRVLLVLDNCEHLRQACATLARTLLSSGAEVRFLATSREPLHAPGEVVLRPRPLASDSNPATGPAPAVRLFVDRARALRQEFDPDDEALGVISRICAQLDGLPLAIELAAARTPHLTVQQIEERLAGRLRLVKQDAASERHRTLEAAIQWSHDLLTDEEQILLRRLSVFRGTFSLAAVEAVCSEPDLDPDDIVDLLGRLVDRSLVDVEFGEGDESRYRLLQMVLNFAAKKLGAERDRVGAALTEWLIARASDPTVGPDKLHVDTDSARAALDFAAEHAPRRALVLAAHLVELWEQRLPAEGIGRLDALLRAEPERTAQRAAALNALGTLLQEKDVVKAQAVHEEALSIANEVGDLEGALRARVGIGSTAALAGDIDRSLQILAGAYEEASEADDAALAASALRAMARTMLDRDLSEALELIERAAKLAPAAPSSRYEQETGRQVAAVLIQHGDYSAARDLLEECLDAARGAGDETTVGSCLVNYGRVLLATGDHLRAREALLEALEISDRHGARRMHAFANAVLGELARATGDLDDAAEHYRSALAEFEELGVPVTAQFLRLNLAHIALRLGDIDAARSGAVEVLRAAADEDFPFLEVEALELFGEIAAATGDHQRAIDALAVANARRDLLELPRDPVDVDDYETAVGLCRAALATGFDSAWAAAKGAELRYVTKEILKDYAPYGDHV